MIKKSRSWLRRRHIARGLDGARFYGFLDRRMHNKRGLPEFAAVQQSPGRLKVIRGAVAPILNLCSHVDCHTPIVSPTCWREKGDRPSTLPHFNATPQTFCNCDFPPGPVTVRFTENRPARV